MYLPQKTEHPPSFRCSEGLNISYYKNGGSILKLHKLLVALALFVALDTNVRAASPMTSGVFASEFSKTYEKVLTDTIGDVVRIDCIEETPWTGGLPQPKTRSWSATVFNLGATGENIYIRFKEVTGYAPISTVNVDMTGEHRDQLVQPGIPFAFTNRSVLQMAIKPQSPGQTPLVQVHYECSGKPGF